MDFTLHAQDDNGRFRQDFTGEASYEVAPSGVLIVQDERGRQVTYSPGAWFVVEEEALPDIPTMPRKVR